MSREQKMKAGRKMLEDGEREDADLREQNFRYKKGRDFEHILQAQWL